jgi:hypothetical protein
MGIHESIPQRLILHLNHYIPNANRLQLQLRSATRLSNASTIQPRISRERDPYNAIESLVGGQCGGDINDVAHIPQYVCVDLGRPFLLPEPLIYRGQGTSAGSFNSGKIGVMRIQASNTILFLDCQIEMKYPSLSETSIYRTLAQMSSSNGISGS